MEFMDKNRQPIFNVTKVGTVTKFMDDDGVNHALSKTEFNNMYKTEAEWNRLDEQAAHEAEFPDTTQTPDQTDEFADKEVDLFTVVNRINANILADYDMMILDVKPGYRTEINIIDKQNREISLTLAHKLFRDNSVLEIATNVAHELIHAYNLLMDIKDTCGGGSYHNDMFKALMDEIGLEAEKTRGQGWGNTVPSSNFITAVASLGIDNLILDLPPIESAEDKMAKVRAARAPKSNHSTPTVSLNPNQIVKLWKTTTEDGNINYSTTQSEGSEEVTIIDLSIN